MQEKETDSYKSMAKSSGAVAFVQVFQMFFGLIRNKAIALIVGASGFGIWSLYQTFLEMTGNFSVFGLDRSGVREIAINSDNEIKTGRCVFTFRLVVLLLSIICSAFVYIFSDHLSHFVFNSTKYAIGFKILAGVIVFQGIYKAEYSILNGLRAIKYLAISQIIGAIAGALGAIFFIYFGKEDYIVFALSVVILTGVLTTTYFVHKLHLKIVIPSYHDFFSLSGRLVYVGMGFMISGVVSAIMTLLSRSYLSSHYSLDAVGIYQASWTISNLYIGIILSAMGIDFLPRISKVSEDNTKVNKLINEQIDFAVPIAAIGVMLILFFSPIVLYLLYSSDFVVGTNIIRWQVIGVYMRVMAFPFSYAISAMAKPFQYAITQIIFWSLDYILLMFFSSMFGFDGLGINYVAAYVVFLSMVYLFTKYNSRFSFSRDTKVTILSTSAMIALTWVLCYLLDGIILYIIGICVFSIQLYIVNLHIKNRMQIDMIQYLKNKFLHKK